MPLPQITLLALRKYYKTHCHPKWIFPALGRNGGKDARYVKKNVSDSGVQGVLRSTLKRLKFKKRVHTHVFRHADATHLLEANIPIRHVQKIFQKYGPQYMALYGDRMPQTHKKTIRDIIACRNGSLGTMVYECRDCRNLHFIDCCGGNRHCPNCQQNKADQWLTRQMKKLLPTHYFLLTNTLPQGLRNVVRSHQRQSYSALFSCVNEALKKLAQDSRFVGSDRIGFLAALHTWGGMLQFHPHLHLIVPGGALSGNNDQWIPSRQDLFVHTAPLAVIFKAKFRDAMKKAGLLQKIDPGT